ncbi:MAG: rhodanese-like domain-containing protein [Gemmatimonadota bacterium]|nr:rhodanese-like domain-containing protein [Gemmatimonadota bacterium]
MKSYADLVNDARTRVPEVTVSDVRGLREAGKPVVLLDVRDQAEVNLGMIPGALHISRGTLEGKVERAVPRDAKVVLYCSSGNRSLLAGDMLRQMGYSDVSSLAGGIRAWVEQGGDLDE